MMMIMVLMMIMIMMMMMMMMMRYDDGDDYHSFPYLQPTGWIDYKQSTAVFMFEPNAMHFRSLTSILHKNKVPRQRSSIYLSIYPSMYLIIKRIYPSFYRSIHPTIYPFNHPSIYLSAHLSIYLTISHLSHPSIYPGTGSTHPHGSLGGGHAAEVLCACRRACVS
jgi:hypothetical protein